MDSHRGNKEEGVVDLWSEIVGSYEGEENRQKDPSSIAVVYKRRRGAGDTVTNKDSQSLGNKENNNNNRLSFAAPTKRISWRRSLSTRGRISIAISVNPGYQQLRQKEAKKKTKQVPPKRKIQQPPNHEKELLQAYFEEVDSYELAEESPSPKNFGTWNMGIQSSQFVLTDISSRLGKWLAAKKLDYSCGPSARLSSILETPNMPLEAISIDSSVALKENTLERGSIQNSLGFAVQTKHSSDVMNSDVTKEHESHNKADIEAVNLATESFEEIEVDFKRLSLSPQIAPSVGDHEDPYATLLRVCKQSAPSTLLDVVSRYCNPDDIVKIGEGTFGEAFKAGATVCKIVPFDGDMLVNGEVQKRSAELLEEVLLSQTLNGLKDTGCEVKNACTNFIDTMDIQVCQGPYDASLVKAWAEWHAKHVSDNDHPKQFPEKQFYVVFVLAHGGEDLEHFVLSEYNHARSLLVQVTAALAVAEAAYEFEHRDLHWGNILLSYNKLASVPFTLEGKTKFARSFGLSVSIIDFTLSRINTGKTIHFLDLSSDPDLFDGPKGSKQAETYKEMKKVTEDLWEGSFPKTNVLWLKYLVDILLVEKSYKRSSNDARDLRSLKKRLKDYDSAKETLSDPFFSDLLVEYAV